MKGTGSGGVRNNQLSEPTGGVRGVGVSSLGVNHLLGVAVVGSDAEDVTGLLARVVDGPDSRIGSSDGLDSRVKDTSVADHVGRSKVAHDKLVLLGLEDLGDLVGDTLRTHLRLLVVGSDLGRGDHRTLLALVLLLDTAVEEESNVGVLLSLCEMLVGLQLKTTHRQCESA